MRLSKRCMLAVALPCVAVVCLAGCANKEEADAKRAAEVSRQQAAGPAQANKPGGTNQKVGDQKPMTSE